MDGTRGWTREAQGASLEDDLGHPEKRKRLGPIQHVKTLPRRCTSHRTGDPSQRRNLPVLLKEKDKETTASPAEVPHGEPENRQGHGGGPHLRRNWLSWQGR